MPIRNTIQRKLVFDTVNKLKSHATADEIYNFIITDYPNISRGTVYRNLNDLSESGEIRRIQMPDGADRYDHLCHEHFHIKCETCGRVFDVDMEYIPNLTELVKDKHGFEFHGQSVIFTGVCPDCNKKKV